MTAYVDQANTGTDAFVSSRSVDTPAGVATGDVAVFWLIRWHDVASFPSVTAPSGAVLRGTIATGSVQTQCYLLKVTDETSFSFSWTPERWSALSALFFTGVDPDLNLAEAPFNSVTGSGATISEFAVSTVDQAALAWNVNTIDAGPASHTPPESFTEVGDVTPWASAYRIAPGDGSHSATGATNASSVTWAAGMVALPPDPIEVAQAWYFTPPTVEEGPAMWNDPLFIRVKITRGVSVLEGPPGTYRTARFPTQDEIAASSPAFYQGGHVYVVDTATKTSLISGSIGVTEANFTPYM